jgi:two-component system, NtrC family, sensor kinase
MDAELLYRRYQELQSYVGWTQDDTRTVHALSSLMEPHLLPLIDDFYAEIERHPDARKVITGGPQQIERLKGTLVQWLRELFTGRYDRDYVLRRWRVGCRHVEIGLDQVFTNVALSRLRTGLVGALGKSWQGDRDGLVAAIQSLNKLLDLDLAKIEDAYQAEHLARQQRSDRLAAIGQVAGGVAHELRNPLNVVRTSVYFLINARSPKPEKVAEHLHRIEQHVAVADGVITALSNFAKMPVPDMVPFSVERCVKEALATNVLPPHIQTTVDLPAELPPTLGDSAQIGIVFANLIRNARDAMPNGGRLTVTGKRVGDAVEVAFSDTGVGIPPENLHRIMEPLYSTKARGIGLGLALARAILDKHKGSLAVTSEVGQGSTFIVSLLADTKQETHR